MATYFSEVKAKVPFEGPSGKGAIAYRRYQPGKSVGEKTLTEHLRPAINFGSALSAEGPCGVAGASRAWLRPAEPMQRAEETVDAGFELMDKLGVKYYCFSDRDIAPEGYSFEESGANLVAITTYLKSKQKESGARPLWGCANLAQHPRYQAGGATSPDPHVFAYAACQTRQALDATHALGGLGFLFAPERDGFDTPLNTDLGRERAQFARFLAMAADYAHEIGFAGQLLLATNTSGLVGVDAWLSFLREFDLLKDFRLQVSLEDVRGIALARLSDALGGLETCSISDAYHAALGLREWLSADVTGGVCLDCRPLRQSHQAVDLIHSHVGLLDGVARALDAAEALRADGRFDSFVKDRYAGWDSDLGRRILAGRSRFSDCEKYVQDHGEVVRKSGRQEMLENLASSLISEA